VAKSTLNFKTGDVLETTTFSGELVWGPVVEVESHYPVPGESGEDWHLVTIRVVSVSENDDEIRYIRTLSSELAFHRNGLDHVFHWIEQCAS
jgi:hypothetical protein